MRQTSLDRPGYARAWLPFLYAVLVLVWYSERRTLDRFLIPSDYEGALLTVYNKMERCARDLHPVAASVLLEALVPEEKKAQYGRHNLQAVDPSTLPVIPEPASVQLLTVAPPR